MINEELVLKTDATTPAAALDTHVMETMHQQERLDPERVIITDHAILIVGCGGVQRLLAISTSARRA